MLLTNIALSFTLSTIVLAEPSQTHNFLRRSSLRHNRRADDQCAARSSESESYSNFIHRYHTSGCHSGKSVDWWYKLCCVPLTDGQTDNSLSWCLSGPPAPSSSVAAVTTQAPYVAPAPAPAYVAPTPAPAPAYVAPSPAPAPAYVAPATTYVAPAPAPAPAASNNQVFSGGQATFFYQNGVAGACGTVHGDWEFVAALQTDMYANGANCGRKIVMTNNAGVSVTAVVADMCPSCVGKEYVDLSKGAFLQIATEAQGMIPMKWQFV